MKAKFLKLSMLLLCMGGLMTIQAQGLYNLATLDDEDYENRRLKWTSDYGGALDEKEKPRNPWTINFDEIKDVYDEGVEWANFTAGGGVGFGWSDDNGNSTTSYCASAEFLAKVLGADKNPYGAGYAGVYGTYYKEGSDNIDESILEAGVKFTYFDPISAFNRVQLLYGASAFFETGSRDFSNSSDNICGFGARAYTGVGFRVNNKVSVGVEVPVVSYRSRTFENNGFEFKSDSFSGAINKDNPIMATMRWNIAHGLKFGGKDTDGDGIYDKDDACPNTPGLDVFNGCPDTDGDGIEDNSDSCPDEAGPASNNGCPESN